jgi:hypothetical protein
MVVLISMETCSLLSVDISNFSFNLPLISASVYIKYIYDCCLEEKFTYVSADVSVEQYVRRLVCCIARLGSWIDLQVRIIRSEGPQLSTREAHPSYG